jgi:histone deacetylase 1/2
MCIFVLINVDDIIVVSNADTAIDTHISNLGFEFAIKYLGELSYFLGIHVTKTENGLHLHQEKYVFDLLHHMKMTGAKPALTPCISGAKLSKFSGDPLINCTVYRSMVGALQYLTLTRPNISYSVNQLCQFLHFPTNIHLTVAKRVLKYLKGTLQFGLQFNKGSLQLNGFCDSDWAGNLDDQKYTSGYCIYLGSCLIS